MSSLFHHGKENPVFDLRRHGLVHWKQVFPLLSYILKKAGLKIHVEGMDITELEGGVSIRGGTAPANKPDFTVYAASAAGVLQVGVKFGSVSSYIPSTLTDAWPDVFTADTTPPYTYIFPVFDDGVVYLHATVEAVLGVPTLTGLTIEHGSSVPDSDAMEIYQRIGQWTVSDGALFFFSDMGIGSQGFLYCGSAGYFWAV